ncbi:MAG: dephospho-CoA kinase [Bacteroidales bacterium]|nr:dephospho-CoA kinase [Bacteroidales bacterium]MBP5503564.1 dephospho-CoA kinase [Bacteroidales bacterium]
MKIIGLTGGIGSGKSTVAQVFEICGAKLFIADTEANVITATHPVAIKRISDVFGTEIYKNGILDRKALASIVFADPEKLQTLNSIVHPLVKEAFDNFVHKHSVAPYIIMESAILVQCGFYRFTDFNVLVSAPEDVRIKRVMQRNGVSAEEVRRRISAQMSDSQTLEHCKYNIVNDGQRLIIPQIEAIWQSNR